jgi:hypothetical protein
VINTDARRRGFAPDAVAGYRVLDVYGKHMLGEWVDGTWQTCVLGSDGKRSLVEVPIPASLTDDELAQYFDDLYHETATPLHPSVVRLP